MKKLLKKFGVTKDIELTYPEFVKAGGQLCERDFNNVFFPKEKKKTKKVSKSKK